MTVKSVDGEGPYGEICCEWFGSGSTLKTNTFHFVTLKEADPPVTLEDLVCRSYEGSTEGK